MPKSKDENQRIKEEKRERILNESIVLFAQHGFSETTIAMIAKASDVSFGSVFTYYKNKEELFEACVIEPLDQIRPLFSSFVEYEGSPLSKIREMVKEQVVAFSKQRPYLALVQYVLGQPSRFSGMFDELDKFAFRFRDRLSEVVKQGQEEGELMPYDPKVVALSYLCFLFGIRLTILDKPDHPIWELFMDQGIRLFGPIEK